MSGIFRQSFDDTSNAQETEILGGTNQTKIGNTGDRLKVEAQVTSVLPPGVVNFRIDDMNASNGGVARDTAINSTTVYTTLYSKSAAGQLYSFTITFEGNLIGADPFNIKLTLDSVDIFVLDTDDIGTAALYNQASDGDANLTAIQLNSNTFTFKCPAASGLTFNTSIAIAIKKSAGGSKRFRAGFVTLSRT